MSTEIGRETRQASRHGEVQLRLRVRADALPEYTRYRDDGCDIHPHCLSCPLPRCRYEEPGGLRALMNADRDAQIIQLRLEGMAVEDLADRFRVSRRTVFRVLCRAEAPAGRRKGARTAEAPVPIRREMPAREANCA